MTTILDKMLLGHAESFDNLFNGKVAKLAFEILRDKKGNVIDTIPLDPRAVSPMENDKNEIVGWIQYDGVKPRLLSSKQVIMISGTMHKSITTEPWDLKSHDYIDARDDKS